MYVYKGFNKDLACTLGQGTYQYAIGRTEETLEANCVRNGFHSVEEPISVLGWYPKDTDRYCLCVADGDIHEDDEGRISSTKITLIKELDRKRLALHECKFLMEHPDREYSNRIQRDTGKAVKDFVIVRGKNPKAAGKKGTMLCLLQEEQDSNHIQDFIALDVDGCEIQENVYYDITGKEILDDKERIAQAPGTVCHTGDDRKGKEK